MPSQRGEPFSAQGCVYLQHDDCWRPLGGTESKSTMSLLRLSVSRMRLSALPPPAAGSTRGILSRALVCRSTRMLVSKSTSSRPPAVSHAAGHAVRLTVTPLCAVARGCW